MQLAEFIRNNHRPIIEEWEEFARSLAQPERNLSRESLRDHADDVLDAIADDMESIQSAAEQRRKSKGQGEPGHLGEVGGLHAVERFQGGFSLDHLVAEYRALRASVLRLWEDRAGAEIEGVTRFNEAIDEALGQATARYTHMMDQARDQFIGILGHELRNPLAAVTSGVQFLGRTHDENKARIAANVLNSTKRMGRMVSDLLDLTRARLGSGIPIERAPVDLAVVCLQIVAEVEAALGKSAIDFEHSGDLTGKWDRDRLAQVVCNLLANAIQHGKKGAPVVLRARGERDEVILEVHNEGRPIPRAVLGTLLEPLVREPTNDADTANRSGSLGLGLYIANEVVTTHGGRIDVTSTEEHGTTFSVVLPRTPGA